MGLGGGAVEHKRERAVSDLTGAVAGSRQCRSAKDTWHAEVGGGGGELQPAVVAAASEPRGHRFLRQGAGCSRLVLHVM